MPYRADHTQYGTASVYEQLYSAIVSAAEDMPPTSNRNKVDFTPLTKIKSQEELAWTLEYVRNAYEKRIPTCTMRGAECLLIVDDDEFHPVFLLATLYVLLWAGA